MKIAPIGFAAALLCTSAAVAQTAPQSQPTSYSDTDIIVTAQKREQSLQDVSVAVSAVSASRLTDSQVNNLQDLQTIVPSVNFGSDFNQAKIFIRGVGANTSTTGSSTGVALHVDGAYVARAEAQLTSLFDLQRVEVLRGPQGTLYGRNAVGGSINLITAKPTRDLSGYLRLTYGDYNQIVSEAAISGPITDNILFRVAAKTEDRDGFGTNPVTGQDIDDLNRRMLRGHLQFDFSPDVSLLLTGEYFHQNDSSGAVHYLRASFPGVARLAPLGVGGYATKTRDLASEIQPGTNTNSYAFTGTFHAQLTDSLSLTNIANYRNFKSILFQDLDLSGVVDDVSINGKASTIHERSIDSKQFSNELQLNYESEFVTVVLGGYYFHERQRPRDKVGYQRHNGSPGNLAILERDIGLLNAKGFSIADAYDMCGYSPETVDGTLIVPKRVCTKSNLGDNAYAIFGQANIDFGAFNDSLEGISLKLGGRYSHEKVTSENPSIIMRYNGADPDPAHALPTLVFNAADNYNQRSFNDFTPEIGIQYQPNSDWLLYYTYSEGFKAGSGENASNSSTIVDPETIKNHEVGIKASFFERRLSVNLAGYHYKLDGLQLNKTISGGPTGYTTIFDNAAKTSATGVEAEFFGEPVDGLRVSGGLSYTDAKFDDYLTLDPLNPVNVAGGPVYDAVTNPDPTAYMAPGFGDVQLAGNQLRNTPKWAWNLHGEWDLPIPELTAGTITLSGDVSYKSRIYFSEFERDIEGAKAYTMVDASVRFTSSDGHIEAQAWAKNLFDVERRSSTFAMATGRLLGAIYLPPRTYGVTLGYRF